ncbi:MFS transporter [Parerythrobacter lacustris]|uniref:MFS transporter n=1 Tax=Parerythrobacter lacustris TaxID=2969984 RepID=A0ABT1XMA9_9SPHN|nr:MFS transporter [Parerythrobacter lacustris]MCR2832796.1 MFS transporter [Parerythrobacter lacustris]
MDDPGPRQSLRFLLLYGLAAAGGAVAYVPFLTILLPLRVNALSGNDNVEWLAMVTFGGAIAASATNIAFGWLSDLTRRRRSWIALGLCGSSLLLVAMAQATSLTGLIALVFCWQVTLNMMLAPLAAWAGDCVPDRQKGLLGGLLAFAPALGASCSALVTYPGLAGPDARLVLVAALVVAMVLPALLFGKPHPMPHLMDDAPEKDLPRVISSPSTVAKMWAARLLVQIAEAALFAYLFFWLRSFIPDFTDSDTARLFGLVLLTAIPLSFAAGRWADRTGRPIAPLAVAAGFSAIGLVVMALAHGVVPAIVGYFIFSLAASVFLAQHSSQVLQVLPAPKRRGRDLGIFNLTNTIPSLIMPVMTIALVPRFGFSGMFALMAVLAAVACAMLATMARAR